MSSFVMSYMKWKLKLVEILHLINMSTVSSNKMSAANLLLKTVSGDLKLAESLVMMDDWVHKLLIYYTSQIVHVFIHN